MNCDCLHDNRADAVLGKMGSTRSSGSLDDLYFCLGVRQNGENLRTDITRGTLPHTRRNQTPLPLFMQNRASDF